MRLGYIALYAAIAAVCGGCESLDYTPGDQMSGQTFWQTEDHARQAAVGMYAAMKEPWCFGMEFTFDMCSDLALRRGPMCRAAMHFPPTAPECRIIGSTFMSWCTAPTP